MTRYRLLITDDLPPQALERLATAEDVNFDVVRRPTPEKLRDIIPAYHALIIRTSVRVDAEALAATTQLKVIGRAGVELDNVDIDAASLRGVIVMNTPGANTIATAEHMVAMLLALCRHVPQAEALMRADQWARSQVSGVQLYRKTLGIVGLGRVGAQVARRTRAFGLTVIAFDPCISEDVARELNVTLVDLDELLTRSDFVTLHTALTQETRVLVNAQAIARMKPGVHLVKCARGALVDEAALVDAYCGPGVGGTAG